MDFDDAKTKCEEVRPELGIMIRARTSDTELISYRIQVRIRTQVRIFSEWA